MSIREPYSKEQTGPLVSPWLLFGKDSRVVTLFGSIQSSIDMPIIASDSVPFLAEEFFADLMLLGQRSKDPVSVIINNRGGSVMAGLAIINGLEHLQQKGIDVDALVLCASMSMATVILASCTKGKRYAMDRSVIHLHSGHQKISGTPEEIEQIKGLNDRLIFQIRQILAERTTIPEYYKKRESLEISADRLREDKETRMNCVKKFLEGETYLTPQEALEAGIIDKIITPEDPELDLIFKLKNSSEGGTR